MDVSTLKATLWSPDTSYAKSKDITDNNKLFLNMWVIIKLNKLEHANKCA